MRRLARVGLVSVMVFATGILGAGPAMASKAVSLDTANPLANFTQEGGQSFVASPTVLSVNDASISDTINFFRMDSLAAPGTPIDLLAHLYVRTTTPAGVDTGVHLVINDGQAKAVIAALVTINGVRGVGLASGTAFTEPSNYGVFVPGDWSAGGGLTVGIRRTAAGDGEITQVNGVAPSPRALLVYGLLAPRNRVGASVEFGCTIAEATANVEFTQFSYKRGPRK